MTCPACDDQLTFSVVSRFDHSSSICYACGVIEAVGMMVMERNGEDPATALVGPGVVDMANMSIDTLQSLIELLRSSRIQDKKERVN